MGLFIGALVVLSFLNPIDLLSHLANSILTKQNYCLDLLPETTKKPILEAVICGRNLPKEQLYSALQNTGLLHLVVVSGAHLVCLEQTLNRLRKLLRAPFWSIDLILLLYTLLTGFQPPLVRALVQRATESVSNYFQINLPPSHTTFISGWLCLALIPQWHTSLSFQLSWVASMVLAANALGPASNASWWQKGLLKTNFQIYIFLFPLIAGLTPTSPITILINSFAIPLMGGLIIPFAATHAVVGHLHTMTFDYLWQQIETGLILLQDLLNLFPQQAVENNLKNEIYFHIALIYQLIRHKRPCS